MLSGNYQIRINKCYRVPALGAYSLIHSDQRSSIPLVGDLTLSRSYQCLMKLQKDFMVQNI